MFLQPAYAMILLACMRKCQWGKYFFFHSDQNEIQSWIFFSSSNNYVTHAFKNSNSQLSIFALLKLALYSSPVSVCSFCPGSSLAYQSASQFFASHLATRYKVANCKGVFWQLVPMYIQRLNLLHWEISPEGYSGGCGAICWAVWCGRTKNLPLHNGPTECLSEQSEKSKDNFRSTSISKAVLGNQGIRGSVLWYFSRSHWEITPKEKVMTNLPMDCSRKLSPPQNLPVCLSVCVWHTQLLHGSVTMFRNRREYTLHWFKGPKGDFNKIKIIKIFDWMSVKYLTSTIK